MSPAHCVNHVPNRSRRLEYHTHLPIDGEIDNLSESMASDETLNTTYVPKIRPKRISAVMGKYMSIAIRVLHRAPDEATTIVARANNDVLAVTAKVAARSSGESATHTRWHDVVDCYGEHSVKAKAGIRELLIS
jgi:hypothetical protein